MSHLLSIIVFSPFIGAALLFLFHPTRAGVVRAIALCATLPSLAGAMYLLGAYDYHVGGFQFRETYPWLSELGIQLSLGADGISVPMVLASSILVFSGVFASWRITDRPREFFILLLILAASTIGVYVSLDIFFLYFFYELSVIPMYLLVGVWGRHLHGYLEQQGEPVGPRGFILNFAKTSKEYAAMKLTLVLAFWAVVALLGILLVYVAAGLRSFDLLALSQVPFSLGIQRAAWLLLFIGFAAIAPAWPLHSWSPVGYASAPAAASMLHAGALAKLGHFAVIRIAFLLFPEATREFLPWVAVLALINILYAGLVALSQKDAKFIVGYSSTSHMGYVFLGVAAMNTVSLTGAVFYMFAHAMSTPLLFALTGYLYYQTKTLEVPLLGGLGRQMPFLTGCFLIACAASFGMPGTADFIAKLMILVGSWTAYPIQTAAAIVGIGLTLTYLFVMLRGIFYGASRPELREAKDVVHWVDRLPMLIMILVSLVFGIFPTHLINVIQSGVIPLVMRVSGVAP